MMSIIPRSYQEEVQENMSLAILEHSDNMELEVVYLQESTH